MPLYRGGLFPEKDKSIVKRKLMPVALMFSEFYFYLTAFIDDEEVKKNFNILDDAFPTIYRIDRIKKLKVLDEHFHIPYNNRFEEGRISEKDTVHVRRKAQKDQISVFRRQHRAVLDRLPTAKVLGVKDGVYTVSAEVFGDGIDMWIRSQGERVKNDRFRKGNQPYTMTRKVPFIFFRMIEQNEFHFISASTSYCFLLLRCYNEEKRKTQNDRRFFALIDEERMKKQGILPKTPVLGDDADWGDGEGMDGEKNRKMDRVLDLYTKFLSGAMINKEEEAKAYGVNERSIQRDIDDIRSYLEAAGMNTGQMNTVIYDRSCHGYCLEKDSRLMLKNRRDFWQSAKFFWTAGLSPGKR